MIDTTLLKKMIAEEYVQVQKHKEAPLYIYNYTPKAQYERFWNEVTLACRGLILDAEQQIIARPFPKFFNLGELEELTLPEESFEVYEKMDGSLGISYWLDGQVYIATRGSFQSPQAKKATQLLHDQYSDSIVNFKKEYTYLFEIIYPENRIVVNYGGIEQLVLLAIIDKASGAEMPLENIGIPIVKSYAGISDFERLKDLEEENKEGFVIKYQNGYRLKIKFAEYVRLHRLVTGISSVSVWEALLAGQSFEELLADIPDEFYQWVKAKKAEYELAFQTIETIAKQDFKTLATRKETAAYFLTCQYPRILFQMLDEKDYAESIWRMLRPTYEKPYQPIGL